jgi:hypothetical protein
METALPPLRETSTICVSSKMTAEISRKEAKVIAGNVSV